MNLLFLVLFLIFPAIGFAQFPSGGIAVQGRDAPPGDAIPVRCVNTAGDTFEACGGGGVGGGDGAILDGVSSSIKATVKDFTNSNPLAVAIVDSNGDQVSVGGGTQYGQGTAATDTDQLMMAGCVRADAAAVATGVVDGDRARCIVDATGKIWVNVGTVPVTGPLTDAELRATPVPIGGTVTVTDGSGALNVIIDSLPTVTVTDGSGALNVIVDSSALPSGAATAALQDGIVKDGAGDTTQANVSSGRLHTDGSGVTQPVSGTVTATGPLTDAELRADPVPVSGTVTVTDGAGALNVICDSGCSGGTQYDQGAAAGDTDKMSMAGAVRKDTAAIATGVADGDVTRLSTDSAGRLRTTAADTTQPISGTVTVTDGSGALNVIVDSGTVTAVTTITNPVTVTDGAGALNIICDSGCGGAATFEDDDPFTGGTTAINVIGGVYDTSPPAVSDGSAGAVRINADRALLVDGSAVTQPVSGTVAVTGVSTAAKQDTIIGHVDGIEGILTTIDADTGAIVGHVDGIEGLLTTIDGDTGSIATSNSAIQTATEAIQAAVEGTLAVSGPLTDAELRAAPVVVDLGANNDVTVTSGSITANAGTNLNTSALVTTAAHDAAFGTAGSADAQVRSIQGVASMTPVQTQSNSANIATETTAAAILTSANYAAAFGTAGSADTQVMSVQGIASMTPVQVSQATASNLNATVNVSQVGGATAYLDPCQRELKIRINISQTAGTELINGTASERIYICSFHAVTATAQNIALVSGTGTVCATSTTAVDGFGGATAATGWNFAANGGIQMASSGHAYGNTTADDDNVCLLQSGAGQVSGGLTYVSAAAGL